MVARVLVDEWSLIVGNSADLVALFEGFARLPEHCCSAVARQPTALNNIMVLATS